MFDWWWIWSRISAGASVAFRSDPPQVAGGSSVRVDAVVTNGGTGGKRGNPVLDVASLHRRDDGVVPRVMLYTRTTGYRHDSIAAGVQMMELLGERDGFVVDHGEEPGAFTAANLARYALVAWLSTSGTVLDPEQRAAFAGWLDAGGAFAGIHGAAACEYDWPAYERMVGAWFDRHPHVQPGTVHVEDRGHPSTAHLPARWDRTDEWYSFRTNPRGTVRVLATVDEGTYDGGGMGLDHPIAWCGRYGAGSTWYTALGHTTESFGEPLFVDHVSGGLRSLLAR
jgi:type 1 glutamine amidotransferase